MQFNKDTPLRQLRFAYWMLCDLLVVHYDKDIFDSLKKNVELVNRHISEFRPIPSEKLQYWDRLVPLHNQHPGQWLLELILIRYSDVSKGDDLSWLSALDKRGLNWVNSEALYCNDGVLSVNNEISLQEVNLNVDLALFLKSERHQPHSLDIDKLKGRWEIYFAKAEKFEWLHNEHFDSGLWGYNYLKKSDYESYPFSTNVLKEGLYREYLILAYDLIRIQAKGNVLQGAFVKDLKGAFRVQKNRAEKAAKNLTSRSYDLSEETIQSIDRLSKELNQSKRFIIEEAVKLYDLKSDSSSS